MEKSQTGGPGQGLAPVRKGRGGQNKPTSKSASGTTGEVRENAQAKNLYDAGRGNQQATTNRSRANEMKPDCRRDDRCGLGVSSRTERHGSGLSGSVAVIFGAARMARRSRGRSAPRARVTAMIVSSVIDLTGEVPDSFGLVADVTEYAAVVRPARRGGRAPPSRLDHLPLPRRLGKFGFPFWKLEPADWERVLKVNLIGAVNVAHAFAPAC